VAVVGAAAAAEDFQPELVPQGHDLVGGSFRRISFEEAGAGSGLVVAFPTMTPP
jgi:hypothetical protein